MLKVTIPAGESFNDLTGTFDYVEETTLTLEHSLISVSEWESKWHKSFLSSTQNMTQEEDLDYIRCMTVQPKNVDPMVYNFIDQKIAKQIRDYIEDPMTATTFSDHDQKSRDRRPITAEIIYYQMTELNIPFSCEKWHLNRLLALIKVCSIKRSPGKKMKTRDILKSNHSLNEARKNKLHTRG